MAGDRVVWKFPITVGPEFVLELPEGARFLHVDVAPLPEGREVGPWLWALVDPEAPKVERTFKVHGTGSVSGGVDDLSEAYVGTFLMFDGVFVGHLFEVA